MGNMQGSYKFMCLHTGKIIKQRQFKQLPMPKSVIKRIEELGKQGTVGYLMFYDRNRMPFPWNDASMEGPRHEELENSDETPTKFLGIIVEEDERKDFVDQDDDNAEHKQAALTAENANLDVE